MALSIKIIAESKRGWGWVGVGVGVRVGLRGSREFPEDK